MTCNKCKKETKTTFEVVQIKHTGYVWEQECEHCGHVHTIED